jgi:hypothetical protein
MFSLHMAKLIFAMQRPVIQPDRDTVDFKRQVLFQFYLIYGQDQHT